MGNDENNNKKKKCLSEICKQFIIIKKSVHSKIYKTNSSTTDNINKIQGFYLNGFKADICILLIMVKKIF